MKEVKEFEKFARTKNKKKELKKEYFLHSKSLMLTYPKKYQLEDKQQIFDEFVKRYKDRKTNILTLIVSFETSDEEHPYEHFHVLIEFDRRVKVLDERALDLFEVHGQYENTRNRRDALAYVKKDGDFVSLNNDPSMFSKSRISVEEFIAWTIRAYKTIKRRKSIVPEVLYNKISEKFLGKLSEHHLISFLKNESTIKGTFLRYAYRFYRPEFVPLKSFDIPKKLSEWHQQWQDSKALVMIGSSGIGKTEVMKSLFEGKVLIVRHLDQLKDLNRQYHKLILLDDMNLHKLTREEVIHLLDLANDSGVNVKGSYAVIPKGIPRAITSNLALLDILPDDNSGAIERRIYILELEQNTSLFKSSEKKDRDLEKKQ